MARVLVHEAFAEHLLVPVGDMVSLLLKPHLRRPLPNLTCIESGTSPPRNVIVLLALRIRLVN